MDIEAMRYAAIELTETRGHDAGNVFVWCSGCADLLVQVDDDHVALSDWADRHETIQDAAMPAVLVSAESLRRGGRCDDYGCSGIWDGERWVYSDEPGREELREIDLAPLDL